MRIESIFALEKAGYPSGVFSHVGENLRVLTRDESAYVPPARPETIQERVCPIIIPTHRDTHKSRQNIRNLLHVASGTVVFLCSGKATKEAVATIAKDFPHLDWIAIDGPYAYDHKSQNFETTYSSIAFGKDMDVAQKRNFGLLLARLMGWEAVFFLDDDIEITKEHLQKTMGLLRDSNTSIVGFSARSFPDNSVAVHARRLSNGPIESFIGSGALAVRTDKPILSFFPHIYNEDWLFLLMYSLFSDDNIVWAGTIKQRAYNPYKNAKLASIQEPGDILGESLSILALTIREELREKASFDAITQKLVQLANQSFWEKEINTRITFIRETQDILRRKRLFTPHRRQAIRALDYSLRRLIGTDGKSGIRAEELAHWVQAWVRDLHRWNNIAPPAASCENLPDAIQQLGLRNQFIYNHKKLPQQDSRAFKRHVDAKAELPKELSALDIKTIVPRSSTVIQNLRHTYSIERYLQSRGQGLEHIVTSAARLRFDRPTTTLPNHKPDVTVGMVITPGESLGQICLSLREIIRDTPPSNALQFILWVYSNDGHSPEELEIYRNQVVARLVGETTGTTTFVRSSIVATSDSNIDQLIDNSLNELAYAYWSCKIPVEHLVFVVNSRCELLRWGTFWEFMRGEHKMAIKPLGTYLRSLPINRKRSVIISKYHDEIAQAQTRLRLAGLLTTKTSSNSHTDKLAAALSKQMRRAHLSWLQTDDLAFNFHSHHKDGLSAIITVRENVCLSLPYSSDLPSNIHEQARRIIEIAQSEESNLRSYTVIIHAQKDADWKDIERYRRKLVQAINIHKPPSTIVFTSLTFPYVHDPTIYRRRAQIVVRYMHWLHNYRQKLSIKWRTLN